jgi:nitroreductase
MNPTETIDAAITSRMSCRAFTAQEVARQTVMDILAVASRAPSGTNTQPWQVYVLQGAVRDALITRACAAHDAIYADPAVAAQYRDEYDYYPTEWVSPYIDRRRENGWGLYSLLGIARGEKDKMHAQHQANFRFFGAPVGLMFTVDRHMGRGSLVDYGMFLGNIMVAARARGLHTCAAGCLEQLCQHHQAAGRCRPRRDAGVRHGLGHADTSALVNTYLTPRVPAESFTRWVD